MRFNYEGHDRLGQPVTGFVDAENEATAAQIIRQERSHYAREISVGEVRTLYEKPAIGSVQTTAVDPLAEPKELPSKEIPPKFSPWVPEEHSLDGSVSQQASGEVGKTMPDILRSNLEGISDVLRQLQEWKTAYRTSSENKTPLPPGVPAVGGKTWECYEKHFDAVCEHLFKQAIWQACGWPKE